MCSPNHYLGPSSSDRQRKMGQSQMAVLKIDKKNVDNFQDHLLANLIFISITVFGFMAMGNFYTFPHSNKNKIK